MIGPRPYPPYLPAYPEAKRDAIQAEYLKLEADWQRSAEWTMALNAVPPLLAMLGIIVAALMGPQIIFDGILILARLK